jgi:arylsulfatase A-like enzyme
MPTLAALAGGELHLPQGINGINILPLFYGKPVDTDHRMLYWEFTGKQRAARWGDWKCVTIKKNAPLELYNLKEDSEEQHNLADQHPEMVQWFDEAMRRMHQPSDCWPLEGE